MNQPARVCGGKRGTDFEGDPQGFRYRQGGGLANFVFEAMPVDHLHDDEVRRAILANVIDAHHVRVCKAGSQPRFLLKSAQEVCIRGELGQQHLNGDMPVKPNIFGLIDTSHTALTQNPDKAVPPAEYVFSHEH